MKKPVPPAKTVLCLWTLFDTLNQKHFPDDLEVGQKIRAPALDIETGEAKFFYGLPWGEGDGRLLDYAPSTQWIVVEVRKADLIPLEGKAKFQKGTVVYLGDQKGATDYLLANGAQDKAIVGVTLVGKDDAVLTAGDYSQVTTGDYGTSIAGDYGLAKAGHAGKAEAGIMGTAKADNVGKAKAGYGGTATAGDYGKAEVGAFGVAKVGHDGVASAGEGGRISIARWNMASEKYKWFTGNIGENDLLPNVLYSIVMGKFAAVSNLIPKSKDLPLAKSDL